MTTSKIVKSILFGAVYGINLFFALIFWLCGETGNIMIGILAIVFYRLSLWLAPVAVTVICWIPLKPVVPAKKKILFNLVHLFLCGVLFLVCYLISGNWY